MNNNILFPIETITRELDFKLYLAVLYATKDDKIYIGQHDYLFAISRFLTGGIYLGKNMFLRKKDDGWVDRYTTLKLNNFKIIHLDEEGAVYWGGENEWRRRLSRRLDISKISEDDIMCTWGNFQNKYYHEATNVKNIQTTGHPRFDILKVKYKKYFEDDVNDLKNKFGDFVLIPTAFQWFNNPFGYKDSFSKRVGYDIDDEESRIRYSGYWSYSGKTFVDYIKMVTTISIDYPNLNIIIRPHPSEDLEPYIAAFGNIKNIYITRDKAIAPWILASKIVVSEGCTTTIEAYLAGTPVLLYQPHYELEHDMFLPSLTGLKCKTIADVKNGIDAVLAGDKIKIEAICENYEASSLINNFCSTDSFEKIIDVMESVDSFNISSGFIKNNIGLRLFRAKYYLVGMMKNIIRPLIKKKYRDYLAFRGGFPGFNKDELNKKIKKLEEITGKKVLLEYVNENLVTVREI